MPSGIASDDLGGVPRSLPQRPPFSLHVIETQVDGRGITRLRSSESWIDVSSSTALSHHPPHDVLSTNDTFRQDTFNHARRSQRILPTPVGYNNDRRLSMDCSSQEEYDESESESDRLLVSSNEHIPPIPYPVAEPGQEHDDDPSHMVQAVNTLGDSIAVTEHPLNYQCFTPQPNVFSHPPSSHLRYTDTVPASYFPATTPTIVSSAQRLPPTIHQQRPHQNSQPTDHDAALRASLSTLLSCAAAARGLPKTQASRQLYENGGSSRVDYRTLRVVPEVVARGDARRVPSQGRSTREFSRSNRSSSLAENAHEQSKRKASTSISKDRRATKKLRHVGVTESVTPTLLTWVTAAGVVVLVSAISFSTGYVMGKESGKLEASGGLRSAVAGTGNCSTEATRGLNLRRLRWSGTTSVGA